MVENPEPVKIAVIGSGLAGLTAAYFLTSTAVQASFPCEVHLFEKANTLGMDTHSISVSIDKNGERRIDVPMRSFQGGYYTQLIALYRHLGVEFCQADFTYSFSSLARGIKKALQWETYLIYNGNSGTKGVSRPTCNPDKDLAHTIFARIFSVISFAFGALLLLFNYLRLIALSSPFWRPKQPMTFQQWSQETTPKGRLSSWIGYNSCWKRFTQDVMLPLFSAVCTAPDDDIYNHPVDEFLEYIWLTIGAHHYIVLKGVQDVVSRMAKNVRHFHLGCSITSVERDIADGSKLNIFTTDHKYTGFSHLILATQANSGVPLLASYLSSICEEGTEHHRHVSELVQCLKTFHYCKSIVINHTDDKFLPPDERNRRDLNLVISADNQGIADKKTSDSLTLPPSYTMATHVISQARLDVPIYQTTNPIVAPQRESILSIAVLERAVLTLDSKEALKQLSTQSQKGWWPFGAEGSSLGPLQGGGRLQSRKVPGIWICGSYAHAGIPLLEGCVASARDVVEKGILPCEGISGIFAPWSS